MSAPARIRIPARICAPFVPPFAEHADLETKKALTDEGFEVADEVRLLDYGACTSSISMRSPVKGEKSPRTEAREKCLSSGKFGLGSLVR
jgi:hypothetical protein